MQFRPLPAAMAAALMLASFQSQAMTDPDEQPAAAGSSAQPSAWKVFEGQSFRLESDGNLSCYSEDGQHCKPGTPSDDETLVKPLACGPGYAARYDGATGYDQPNHWCNVVYANLFATWRDYEMLGYPVLLSKTPNNDTMCMSSDGTNCEWGRQKGEPAPGRPIVPVVCGKALLETKWRITGYEPSLPGHWCQSPEIVATSETHPLLEIPSVFKRPFALSARLPVWTAQENPGFLVRGDSRNAKLPYILAVDSEGTGAFSDRIDVAPQSQFTVGLLHFAGDPSPALNWSGPPVNFMAFTVTQASDGTWPKVATLRDMVEGGHWNGQQESSWRRIPTMPVTSARHLLRNTLSIHFDQPAGVEAPPPDYVMTLPRKKPRY